MTNKNNPKFQELVAKLREIFQIDRPELEFGIYRILNARADEINGYLQNRMAEKVQAALSAGSAESGKQLRADLQEAEKNAQALGVSPDAVPKVQELRAKLKESSAGSSEHENAVFSHLLTFFSRYYQNGDFISQRRYKGDTYAIPYAGEEVMLHWANKDQYYTKSGENFSNYSFKLEDGRSVHFRLVAADTAKDNSKDNDKERRFALVAAKTVTRVDDNGDDHQENLLPIEEVEAADGSKELVIRFEYAAQPKGTKQDKLVVEAVGTVLDDAAVKASWLALGNRAPTEKNPQRTLLEKHLSDYTTKNTADYFIHKDLGGFLRRELDFYIKNEVMHLDDVQNAGAFTDIEKNLRMIQCLRSIALELITFLAQLEDFQKKLWLKRRFVVRSEYCVRLSRLPNDLRKIATLNERQIEEWKLIFGIDVAKASESELTSLVVDTQYFSAEFKRKLVASIEDLTASSSGLLIHGDNRQALRFLQARHSKQVACVYIDPPFNTGHDFLYKDKYRDSSWLSLISDGLSYVDRLIKDSGCLYLHLDYNCNFLGRQLLNTVFGEERFLNEITWQRSTTVGSSKAIARRFPTLSDTIYLYVKSKEAYLFNKQYVPPSEEYKARFNNKDENGFFYWNTLASYSQDTFDRLTSEGKVRWTEGAKFPQYKTYLHELKGSVVPDVWSDIDMLNPMSKERQNMDFETQKPERLIKRAIETSSNVGDTVIDFFSGSGTTVCAAHKLGRKWIGVEQGEHFHSRIMKRMKQALAGMAPGIENGNPSSDIFEYIELESYEDSLNNLQLRRSDVQGEMFGMLPQEAKDDYLLNYLLDVESRGSLLSVEDFKKPFDYQLNVAVDSAGAFEPRKIDLVETFNYLIGLRVKHIDAQPQRGFVTVTGALPSGESCLVLWRDCDVLDYEGVAKLCDKLAINPADNEFDVVYINGDHNIPTVLTQTAEEGGATRVLKLRQIEPEFLERMFSVEDI